MSHTWQLMTQLATLVRAFVVSHMFFASVVMSMQITVHLPMLDYLRETCIIAFSKYLVFVLSSTEISKSFSNFKGYGCCLSSLLYCPLFQVQSCIPLGLWKRF